VYRSFLNHKEKNKIVFLFLFFLPSLLAASSLLRFRRQPVVVIDPSGSASDLGRMLVENYERAETLKFAQELKNKLLEHYRVRTVISRAPGEDILPLQIASFSNRLVADFFLRIHIYREESEKPRLFLYHLMTNRLVDLSVNVTGRLGLIPLHQAHIAKIHETRRCGKRMFEHLNQECFKKHFDCNRPLGLPLKKMFGVEAPAILLEVGVCRERKLLSLVDPIAKSLCFLADIK